MHACERPRVSASTRKPLAACIGAIFALTAPPAYPIAVNNCMDIGAGSLRAAVAGAAPGDTVDMTGLPCSTITLTSGELVVSQAKLTLQGPGVGKLLIEGNGNSRVLNHQGSNLYVNDLSIANGYVYSPDGVAAGGCIYSDASVSLTDANVSGCTVQTYSGMALGGGIYAANLSLTNSTVSSSTARCYSGGSAVGGGANVKVAFSASSSSIRDNSATCRPGGTASSGGAYIRGEVSIGNSTISGNSSSGDFGGLNARPFIFAALNMLNSTISGNVAAGFVGGLASYDQTTVANSTIVFNTAGAGSPSSGVYRAPGLHISYAGGFPTTLESSLVANNTYGVAAKENDFSLAGTALSAASVNNLIRQTTASLPSTNIQSACPWLGPLRNNGGPTSTHALLSHSPGIDAGNNSDGFANDQRGPPYARVSGSAADVGAYEVQQGDVVFNAGFDGCPAL